MKYIKLFEHGLDQSDLQDIDDMFKEVADKYNLTKIDPIGGQHIHSAERHSYFIKLDVDNREIRNERGKIVGKCRGGYLIIMILLEKFTKGDFNKDLNDFVKRLNKIGYHHLGPELAGHYQGLIPLKLTIWNNEVY